MNKGYTLIELIFALGLVIAIAAVGLLVYVIIHFLAKVW